MSGVKKFSELSKEELIKRVTNSCCYRCDMIQDVINSEGYWSCSRMDCYTICCDNCINWREEIDQKDDDGYCCEECRKKEEEWEKCLCGKCGEELGADCSGGCNNKGATCICNDCGEEEEPKWVEDNLKSIVIGKIKKTRKLKQ
jgi:hypothetical protein